MDYKYYIEDCYSINPDTLTLFKKVYIRNFQDNTLSTPLELTHKRRKKQTHKKKVKNLENSSHSFKLSDNAYRTLKKKITWLYYLAKPKSVTTYTGKHIYNFKINFITLTLSSKQRHKTKDITHLMLNQFLNEIRQRTGMVNYVWRLEFQKNGNVHYHIVTDCYLDYFFVRKIWNKIQANNGYIKPYTDKHISLNFQDYYKLYHKEGKNTKDSLLKSYQAQKSTSWTQPNSVDVKSVHNKRKISLYIAKYFGKDSKAHVFKNELDSDNSDANMRLWFCSRGLSKLNNISGSISELYQDLYSIVKSAKGLYTVYAKYASSFYYNIATIANVHKSFLNQFLQNYAYSLGYVNSS